MRKLIALLICLAVIAGLFVSCARRESISGGPNVSVSEVPGNAAGADGKEANASDPASDTADGSADESEDLLGLAMRLPADTVIRARVTGIPGHYILRYTHPKVPAGLHFTVSLRIYKDEGDGDMLLTSYDSDGTWLADPKQYDPSEREVEQPIDISGSLEDKYVMVSAKCFGDGVPTFSAAAIHDYDGTISSGFDSVFAWEK